MEYTDVYFRTFARLLSRKTWLYTEMIVESTIRHNKDSDRHKTNVCKALCDLCKLRFLWFPQEQHPIACQLGGSDPNSLAEAAEIVAQYHYDEINLNCGCPSDRVAGAGCFGAALMLQPSLVANCAKAISQKVDIPVTIKCRLGVDNVDSYAELCNFVKVVSEDSDVQHFILHARKCLLKGLSPHENRTIPPLKHEWVFALKRDFPNLDFSLNGGILSSKEAWNILSHRSEEDLQVRSVMVGRAAYDNPWHVLASADQLIFGEPSNPCFNRRQVDFFSYANIPSPFVKVLQDYALACEKIVQKWREDNRKEPSLRTLVKPVLNLFHGERHGRKWKALIDQEIKSSKTLNELFERTLPILPDEVLDQPPGQQTLKEVAFATGQLPCPVEI